MRHQLIMEGWRSYLSESQASDTYGSLYLFEDDTVSKTSFYDAINMLSESDEDTATFLENWERSVDHMFGSLDEAIPIGIGVESVDDAILNASTQAYMALGKMKGKAFGSVLNVVNKMKGFAEKNPKTAKVVAEIGKSLAVAAAFTAAIHVVDGNSMNFEGVQDTLDTIMRDAARAAQDITDAANTAMQDLEGNAPRNQAPVSFKPPPGWEYWGEYEGWVNVDKLHAGVENMGDNVSQAVGDPGLEQAMSGWEDSMEQQWQGDPGFFADEAAAQAAPTGGIDWQSMNPGIDPEVYDKYGPHGEDILGWEDAPNKQQALQNAQSDWEQFKKMADTFESGGSLEDLDMSRRDFKKWAADAVYAPDRADSVLKRAGETIGQFVKTGKASAGGYDRTSSATQGIGSIPPNYMKWLRKAMRASLKT